MQFVYHPDFVEQAVFLATRLDPGRECELHQRIDRLYSIPDAEARDIAFREAYAEQFTHWRLGAALEAAILAWRCRAADVPRCLVVPAGRGSNQHLDLLSKANGAARPLHTLLVQVNPGTLFDPALLRRWIEPELWLLADMLSDDFGYSPNDLEGAAWERNVRRDRYMVLWRTYVAGRMLGERTRGSEEVTALRAAFRRAFRHHGADPTDEVFDHVLGASRLTHAQLMAWATGPDAVSEHTGGLLR